MRATAYADSTNVEISPVCGRYQFLLKKNKENEINTLRESAQAVFGAIMLVQRPTLPDSCIFNAGGSVQPLLAAEHLSPSPGKLWILMPVNETRRSETHSAFSPLLLPRYIPPTLAFIPLSRLPVPVLRSLPPIYGRCCSFCWREPPTITGRERHVWAEGGAWAASRKMQNNVYLKHAKNNTTLRNSRNSGELEAQGSDSPAGLMKNAEVRRPPPAMVSGFVLCTLTYE